MTGAVTKCIVPGQDKNGLWHVYAGKQPRDFEGAHCDECATSGASGTCDADPLLGFACSECVKKMKKNGRKKCMVNGKEMGARPNLRQGVEAWFRRQCDTCSNPKARKNQAGCSWLNNRDAWGTPCLQCQDRGFTCWDQGVIVGAIPETTAPQEWTVSHQLGGSWAEVRPSTPWRKACRECVANGNHCRATADGAAFACNRCFQLGIDCVESGGEGEHYPLFDLSRIGIGNFLPFHACDRCKEAGRNCDHQRPCDSCVDNGEQELCKDTPGEGNNKAPSCFAGRLHDKAGPLYYLALGYGAGGVNDVKDGSQLEHWIGPPFPMYQMEGDNNGDGTEDHNRMAIVSLVQNQRRALKPEGIPPHGALEGNLGTKRPSELTAEELRQKLGENWPEIYPMNQHKEYQTVLQEAPTKRRAVVVEMTAARTRRRARGNTAAAPAAGAPAAAPVVPSNGPPVQVLPQGQGQGQGGLMGAGGPQGGVD
ncbi:hypothetical protein CDD80_1250 [Ophiocordyceps camponoti-rufipedis]|uniref:Uncharacterized protein n=1 Tax=Ophiocordyceps camponoti-rufipedis TaxID=2004952 RepID=A0A2C5Y170_9HYPO|nr:hypothetical protein CDD80_1250 [Ophiocordyceps camponoti-rufipedis]